MSGRFKRIVWSVAVVSLLLAGCVRASAPSPRHTTTTATSEPTAAAEPTVTAPTQTVEPTAPATTPKPAEKPSPKPRARTATVRLYFSRDEKVGVVGREVAFTGTGTEARAKAAVKALLKGPSTSDRSYGLETAIPRNTRLRGLTIAKRTATVDLSKRFASGGGSLSMQLRAAQVVCTLTRFPGIRAVAFELDGERIESLGGEGIKVGPSVDRADFENVMPAILVESPLPGQTLTSPVRLKGSANVFEAQFNARIVKKGGVVLAEQPVKASSGSGTRGTFSARMRFDVPARTKATLTVYDISEKDGSVIDRVDIPVRLSP